jgi:hypothetical protein
MATSDYMAGRTKYARPQAMLWSNNPGTLEGGLYLPQGYEAGADYSGVLSNEFIILSDDNRGPINFDIERIENRERMINGRMRSFHVADKLSISASWDLLPSRSYGLRPDFALESSLDPATTAGRSDMYGSNPFEHTTDGGAGGVEMLKWYENHSGSFWVYLAYDKYSSFGEDDSAYAHLGQYNQIVEMFFSDFSYSVEKRGANNFDFWNISVTLEEV